MKRLLFIVAILNYLAEAGQIKKITISDPKETIVSTTDSMTNYFGKDVKKYIGQELYLLGVNKHTDYPNFYKDTKGNTYQPVKKKIPYTKYDAIAEKYFTVLDVTKIPSEEFSLRDFYLFKLEEKQTKEIIFYKYEDADFEFPFIIVGFYLKQKEKFINKEYIVRGVNWNDYLNSIPGNNAPTDINTGLPVSEFNPGDVWKVIDITIKDAKDNMSYSYNENIAIILANSKKEKILLPLEGVKWQWALIEKGKADVYKKLFGEAIWERVLKGDVWLNMTDVMLNLSIGIPHNINKTVTANSITEQWVYKNRSNYPGDRYFYFTDGILTAIQ